MAILKPNKTTTLGGVTVNEYLLTAHNPNRISMPSASMEGRVIGVTVHNTDWISVASTTTPAEQYTRATVNGNMKDVRVHYYVDDRCAWQNLPLTLTGWHAADGSGNGNTRTIAIECIMSSAYNSTDKASEDNCARLAAALLKQLGLGIEHLYTHTHWLNVRDGKSGTVDYLNTAKNSYKNCPLYILPHWSEFKAKVQSYLGNGSVSSSSAVSETPAQLYRVRKSWEDAKSQIGAFASLDNAKKACTEGYSVFDSSGNIVYSPAQQYTVTGHFSSLEEAKKACADGLSVYDKSGKQVYPETSASSETPASAGAVSTEKQMFDFFRAEGLNAYATAGIMGNLYAESGLQSNNLQNTYNRSLGMTDIEYTNAVNAGTHDFVHDSAGYGLAQWTYYSRKQNLLNFAKSKNKSIDDALMQCEFLIHELKTEFRSVYNSLLSANSVRQASDIFMTGFERPTDQSESAKQKRASYGQSYYDKYK